MLSRIGVAIIGIPLLIWILLSGGYPLLLFTVIISTIGSYEFYRMANLAGKKTHNIIGMAMALLIPITVFFQQMKYIDFGPEFILVIGLIVCMSLRVLTNQVKDASLEIGNTLLGAVYSSLLFSYVLMISFLPNGGKWLLTAQILVWVCDSFAYFIGMAIGRKIFNRGFNSISPKKSIEGSVGGIICTIIALFLLVNYFNLDGGKITPFYIVIMGLFISLVAQIGDLGESMFKREFVIKDSGTLLRGHGGILDRFDSMLFVAPVMYYLLKFIIL